MPPSGRATNGFAHARSESSMPLLPYAESSPPASPASRSFTSRYMPHLAHKRRIALTVSLSLLVILLVTLSSATLSAREHLLAVPVSEQSQLANTNASTPVADDQTSSEEAEQEEEYEYSPFLLGPPTQSFRDNLRNDTQYITSWISAGWTNDVMTYANLIYLGVLTDRVPVVAMFTPSHIGGDAAPIPFGEVFDVPRFMDESGIPLLEWDEVKDPESQVVDDLGCWNVWEAVQYNEHFPRGSSVPDLLKLDISYTKAPGWIKLIPDYPHDMCSSFWSLTRLSFPEERARNIGNPIPSPLHNARLDPDEHMLCFDYLYYACAQQSSDLNHDYAPTWRYVLRYLHWTERIEQIAQYYVRQAFGLPLTDAEVPPYIAVHVRHGDFANWCWAAEKPEDCFAPISVIERRVREVQEELRQRKGIDIPMTRVIVTSDEKDPAWWEEVFALGWRTVDHEAARTVEVFGRWYPVLIDAAIQSAALGFVGTDRSTYSVVSRRRVETWNDGATRMVLWGYKGADDH
ncbi:hypothetical protein PYCCODRAFT_1434681 [Trametes coccinea BRFM310]|uniref:Uncharacterized protein n=1 Tax=Trametes coccinea (strain BRFM310) TaxID=1353009 RepID=A0A1Y2IQ70_TRAC3|nr:hypothetical protein PYCCODRAFT_1434681 [Trametes coccinea BRFM310]